MAQSDALNSVLGLANFQAQWHKASIQNSWLTQDPQWNALGTKAVAFHLRSVSQVCDGIMNPANDWLRGPTPRGSAKWAGARTHICNSNKFPDAADAAGLGPTLCKCDCSWSVWLRVTVSAVLWRCARKPSCAAPCVHSEELVYQLEFDKWFPKKKKKKKKKKSDNSILLQLLVLRAISKDYLILSWFPEGCKSWKHSSHEIKSPKEIPELQAE